MFIRYFNLLVDEKRKTKFLNKYSYFYLCYYLSLVTKRKEIEIIDENMIAQLFQILIHLE